MLFFSTEAIHRIPSSAGTSWDYSIKFRIFCKCFSGSTTLATAWISSHSTAPLFTARYKRTSSVGEEGLEPSCPCGPRILSPLRLPIPPLAREFLRNISSLHILRSRPELNRGEGFCRPVPDHSATRPVSDSRVAKASPRVKNTDNRNKNPPTLGGLFAYHSTTLAERFRRPKANASFLVSMYISKWFPLMAPPRSSHTYTPRPSISIFTPKGY